MSVCLSGASARPRNTLKLPRRDVDDFLLCDSGVFRVGPILSRYPKLNIYRSGCIAPMRDTYFKKKKNLERFDKF